MICTGVCRVVGILLAHLVDFGECKFAKLHLVYSMLCCSTYDETRILLYSAESEWDMLASVCVL